MRSMSHATVVGDAELGVAFLLFGRRWVGRRIGEERAQEPHGAQLNPETETGVVTPALVHELSVGVVQVEGPLQLHLGRRSGESPVGGYLPICEELDRHVRSTDDLPARGTPLTYVFRSVLPRGRCSIGNS